MEVPINPALNNPAVEMILQMRRMDRKFKRACAQLVLMNNNIRVVEARYDRAVRADSKTLRYNLRLRILTLQGVRNAFLEYAHDRADKLDALEEELQEKYDVDWSDVCDVAASGTSDEQAEAEQSESESESDEEEEEEDMDTEW